MCPAQGGHPWECTSCQKMWVFLLLNFLHLLVFETTVTKAKAFLAGLDAEDGSNWRQHLPWLSKAHCGGGSPGCTCAVSFFNTLPLQERIPECQGKLVVCNSWPRLGQHENHPAPGQQVSCSIDCVCCSTRDPGEIHLQIVFQIITHWAYHASGRMVLRGRALQETTKAFWFEDQLLPANCSWFLVSPAVPYPEVFLVSMTITCPRAVESLICAFKEMLAVFQTENMIY